MPVPAFLPGRDARAILLTLAAGLAGGAAFYLAGIPLPWLLGSLTATAVAALSGLKTVVFPPLRTAMLAVIGVLLGSSFSQDFLAHAGANMLAISMLVPYTVLATAIVSAMLRRTTALDPVTVFFSAVPGGVNEMTLMGTERGGHEAALAVHHSLRLLLVVLVVSLGFAFAFGGTRAGSLAGPHVFDGWGYVLTAVFGAAGFALARLTRLPAGFILGPMLISAAAHLSGVTDMKPDPYLVVAAQVVAGSALGAQFRTFSRQTLLGAGVTALKIAALLLVFTAAFVWLVSLFVDRSYPVLLLAFAPGGLAEMGLIAISVGADAAFVSASQVSRFFIVVTLAVPLFRLLAIKPAGSPAE